MLEEGERLGREGEDSFDTGIAGDGLGALRQFRTDAAMSVGFVYVETGEFRFLLVKERVQCDDADDVVIDLQDVIVADVFLNVGTGAFEELVAGDGRFDQSHDVTDIAPSGGTDGFVFIGVDEGADAFVGENFGEDSFVYFAADYVNARDAVLTGAVGVDGLREHFGAEFIGAGLEDAVECGEGKLAEEFSVNLDAVMRTDEHEFDGAEFAGEFDGDGVGVEPVRMAVPVEAKRWEDGNDAVVEEFAEHVDVNLMNLAGVEMVNAFDDAERDGLNAVRVGGTEVVQRKAFENFVGSLIGGHNGDAQRLGIGDASAVGVGNRFTETFGQLLDLMACTVNENDADIKATEDGDVEEDVSKIIVGDYSAVNGQDEDPVTELRNIM